MFNLEGVEAAVAPVVSLEAVRRVLAGDCSPTVGACLVVTEAVEAPSDAQRRNLPDAAFALIVTGPPRRRVMPHHINTVKNSNENTTVDVPRLRNALARMNQLRGLSDGQKRTIRAHINRHADSVLKGRQDQSVSDMSDDELLEALRKAA